MKKVLLINNLNDVDQYIKSKIKFNKIIVLDYRAAILCNQKKINFIYVKNLDGAILKIRLDKFYYSTFNFSKKIDKKIINDNRHLKNLSFFSNYSIFSKGLLFIKIYYQYIKTINAKFKNYKIYYYEYNKNNEFDYFLKTIEIFQKKYKSFNKILINKDKKNNFYFGYQEELESSQKIKNKIINFIKPIQNISFYKKKILVYLVNNQNKDLIKSFSNKKKISIINFLYDYKKKKNFTLNNSSKIYFDSINIEKQIIENYVNYLKPFIIKTVLNVTENISKINNIDIFVNGHNTLVSNTIISHLNRVKVKTLSLLHGGTAGHFSKSFFWPSLNFTSLKNKKYLFFQVYSDYLEKNISLQNKEFNNSYPKKNFLKFCNEHFKKLIPNKKNNRKQLNICYVLQMGNSILTTKLNKKNDSYELYLKRNDFFKSILNFKDYNFLISSYNETPKSLILNKELLKKYQKTNQLKIEHLNVIKMLTKSDIAIFEHPSTSYIEALCINVPIIFILNNSKYDFKIDQKILLSKKIYFINSLDEIIPIIKNSNKNKSNNIDFLKEYYSIHKKDDLNSALNYLDRLNLS